MDRDVDDCEEPRRKVSIGEELYEVHLKRSNSVGEEGEEEEKESGNRKRLKTTDDDLLTAPLDQLLKPSPGAVTRRSKKKQEEKQGEIFKKVSEKVAKTRHY